MLFYRHLPWQHHRIIALFMVYLLIESSSSYAENRAPLAAREYQVKAVFLYNFARLTTYPTSVTDKDTFHLCVVGEDPFQNKLDVVVQDAKVQERPLAILRFTDSLNGLEECEVLFVSLSEKPRLKEILTQVRQYPILTVSEIDDFVIRGGMIQFYNTEDNVRFLVDPETITEAGLKASSRFLEIAKIVRRDKQ